ncbi:unnamed protein product [Brassica napus]|uniref:(rape) hypothetical protein n=1 Tax=Brassica napus TaxID=3708 RepID=A0A816U6U1_BRANA|nr:unnamed protein product [Brassica napus]
MKKETVAQQEKSQGPRGDESTMCSLFIIGFGPYNRCPQLHRHQQNQYHSLQRPLNPASFHLRTNLPSGLDKPPPLESVAWKSNVLS